MSETHKLEHVHIVISVRKEPTDHLLELARAATKLVGSSNVHIVIGHNAAKLLGEMPAKVIALPSDRAQSAAIAYAGCHLYRMDPTAIMILVDADSPDSKRQLESNFAGLMKAADQPGAMVTLGSLENFHSIHAWSIYSLMETFRNHCPVDFPIINEIARTWGRDPIAIKRLYEKLPSEEIAEKLLVKIRAGYPTYNVVLKEANPLPNPPAIDPLTDPSTISSPKDLNN